MTVPAQHLADAHKLTADAYVDLFHIILNTGAHIYLKDKDEVTWQGITWEAIPCQLKGVGQHVSEEVSRPTFMVANPENAFTAYVHSGALNRALVMRLRVLRQHLLTNQNIYRQQTWSVTRIASVDKNGIVMELRDQLDGPNAIIPARMFIPPEFPTVSL